MKKIIGLTLILSAAAIMSPLANAMPGANCQQPNGWTFQGGGGTRGISPYNAVSSCQVKTANVQLTYVCNLSLTMGATKDGVDLYTTVGTTFTAQPSSKVINVANNAYVMGWWPNTSNQQFTNTYCAYLFKNVMKPVIN